MVGGRGGGRRQQRQVLIAAFAVALLLGTAVYLRIWTRQSDEPSFADDREELRSILKRQNQTHPLFPQPPKMLLEFFFRSATMDPGAHSHTPRRQFEHANLEAMDESAEWRMKYDIEFGKNNQLQDELLKVNTSLSASAKRSDSLQKDNQMLKRQIEFMKLQCNCSTPIKLTQE